jgi:DNA-binding response OmpR family regulator
MRILIIEDEKDISEFLRANLEAEYFVVDIAEDGERGSYLARTNEYDLIVLDNGLPRKPGSQVCQEIRANKITTPILMLSVQSATPLKITMLNSGADDYVTKPFSFEELLARINALLRRPQVVVDNVFRIDDLIVDTNKHKVIRGKKEIYLTRKEFVLLEYLIKQKGDVISRGKIIEHVWDDEIDPFSKTIEVHILNLRRKIDTSHKKRLIHNIPGRGYKIDVPA